MLEMAKVLRYYGFAPNIMEQSPKIVCPFHDDVRPSMKVDVLDNRYYCFGCAKHGDAFNFVKEIEKKYHGLNDLKAYQKYQEILNTTSTSDIQIKGGTERRNKKSNKEMYDIAYDYYHGLNTIDWEADDIGIPEAELALAYMEYRGFDAKTLKYAKAKVTYKEAYGLIFPMLDNGKFRGWVCRTTEPDIEKYRKYLYNTGFSRSTTLCGSYGSKPYVFVVEGYMDMLKFVQYGIINVVAILGWKMSDNQEKKLKAAGVKHIISALDNDEAGRKGTRYLKTIFKVTRFQYLKGIKDPGEMSKEIFDKCYSRTMKKYNLEKER